MAEGTSIEKFILAVVTMNPSKVSGGTSVFHCKDSQEMDKLAAALEAILDGIAHSLSDDIYIIVKH